MESFSDEVDVMRVEAGNRNSAISRHVDVTFVLQLVDLLYTEACVGEHTNLAGYMAPIVRASMFLKF